MDKKIVIFTSSELRHDAFRIFLSNEKGIKILKSFSEEGKRLNKKLEKENNKETPNQIKHLNTRYECEKEFYSNKIQFLKDKSNNEKCYTGYTSSSDCLNKINNLNPDIIIVYGSSLIKGQILQQYKNRILNVHLGLSPYYTGSGTNFFPFVENEPEYAGATFMFLDEGIDTGQIIHQIRPRIFQNDNIHQIGTRLIFDMFKIYLQIILNFEKIEKINPINVQNKRLVFKIKDFTPETLERLNKNFESGMISEYLKNKTERDKQVPILKQKWINELF